MKYSNQVEEVKAGCAYCGKEGTDGCNCDYKNKTCYDKYDPTEFIAHKVNPHGGHGDDKA